MLWVCPFNLIFGEIIKHLAMLKEDVFTEDIPAVEEAAAPATLSDYETERNKPMPNRIHGAIQSQIGFLLKSVYGDKYQFISELALDTTPGSTPDICIFPKKKLDVKNTPAKETEAPLTTIEIISPSQTFNELMHKAWDLYFPMGVKSAWIVVPEVKAIHIIMPGGDNLYFASGKLKDPATGIEVPVERVFEDLL
ncbi:MAG TPA: Uma2 family endonuclease [Bacteroidetes bacterium]|nr:Uma2 family endonuclease [Bacteroidota bacterium]